MRVLFVSSEVVPFSKTGGLADVAGALPIALEKLGHEVIVFQPAYRGIGDAGIPINEMDIEIDLPMGSKTVSGSLLKSQLPGSNVTIYFVSQPMFFDRDGLYQSRGEEYKDNCPRYVFFCRAVLEAIDRLAWHPDVVHCNDWQTGLIPAYLKTIYRDYASFAGTASLMTIHNMAYHGNFWHWDMSQTGIDWKYFNWQQMEFYGRLNLLKTGIVFADAISTVSPTYAEEIQTPQQGCRLEGVLSERRDSLFGVLNGIDTQQWNPQTDPYLAANYNVDNWQSGKQACKVDLQKILGLPEDSQKPVIGIVSRLTSQKGWPLIFPVMNQWLQQMPFQWVVLGTGSQAYEQRLSELANHYPTKLGVQIGFSDELAHKIEAGIDVFLMPSEYEPCGLNQQYSMQYGTVPVVHATGGLADTIIDANPQTISSGQANGFLFRPYSAEQLETTLALALEMLIHQPSVWQQLVETGMRHDWSWQASGLEYQELYSKIVRRTRGESAQRQTV